jgi:CspA family cold shock protein
VVTTGKVIRFDEFRGYGFVSQDSGGEDVFIHANDLDFDKRLIAIGTQLEFVTEQGDRGLKASQVRIVESSAQSRPPVHTPRESAPRDSAPRESVSHDSAPRDDDGLCDILTEPELLGEFTEALLESAPSLTGAQILAARSALVGMAHQHGWLED